jgi:predicted GIY-YIG superfamily endonuclease
LGINGSEEDMVPMRNQSQSGHAKYHTEPFKDIHKTLTGFSFVYALININDQVYIGYTKNLHHRIVQHNNNCGANATKYKGPWRLFTVLCYASDDDARCAEIFYRKNPYELIWRSQSSLALISRDLKHEFNIDELHFL